MSKHKVLFLLPAVGVCFCVRVYVSSFQFLSYPLCHFPVSPLGVERRFDRSAQQQLPLPNCIRDLHCQVLGKLPFTVRNISRFNPSNIKLPILNWAVYSWVQKVRRNQWHFKPRQTLERDMGLQPVFLWRCSRSRWKQRFEEPLCSGEDTHGLEYKWLILKHA